MPVTPRLRRKPPACLRTLTPLTEPGQRVWPRPVRRPPRLMRARRLGIPAARLTNRWLRSPPGLPPAHLSRGRPRMRGDRPPRPPLWRKMPPATIETALGTLSRRQTGILLQPVARRRARPLIRVHCPRSPRQRSQVYSVRGQGRRQRRVRFRRRPPLLPVRWRPRVPPGFWVLPVVERGHRQPGKLRQRPEVRFRFGRPGKFGVRPTHSLRLRRVGRFRGRPGHSLRPRRMNRSRPRRVDKSRLNLAHSLRRNRVGRSRLRRGHSLRSRRMNRSRPRRVGEFQVSPARSRRPRRVGRSRPRRVGEFRVRPAHNRRLRRMSKFPLRRVGKVQVKLAYSRRLRRMGEALLNPLGRPRLGSVGQFWLRQVRRCRTRGGRFRLR
jgi:hypothetical protein